MGRGRKSALIEFLRFALDNISKVDANKSDHEGKLRTFVGWVIPLLLCSASLTVHAIGSRELLDTVDNPIFIEKIGEDGGLTEHTLPELPALFPILAYSQNEAVHVARSTLRQLDLIDNHLDLSGELARIRN